MSKIIKSNLACLSHTCGSSDARRLYDNLTSFCWSCKTFFPKNAIDEPWFHLGNHKPGDKVEPAPVKSDDDFEKATTVVEKRTAEDTSHIFPKKKLTLEEIHEYRSRGFAERKITKEVAEFYRVKVSYDSNGKIDTHYYPYDSGQNYKVRHLPKKFQWVGNSDSLFGQELFASGGKRLIISEGEIDAMTVAQSSMDRYKKIYPSVAIPSATLVEKVLLKNRDWVRSFGEVVLMFDEDEAGQKARDEALKIIGLDKVKIAKLPRKDPNEVYLECGTEAVQAAIFDAAPYVPSGILTKDQLWEQLVNYRNTPSVPYPECLAGVNSKTKGARLGDIALFISGTSCGKSTLMREIMLSMKEKTPDRIGVVSLEESPAETAVKLAGMELKKNPAIHEMSLEELRPGFDSVFSDDRFIILDHQGSLKDDTILDKLEFMALSGCKYIFIDHVTILVSEGAGDLTGNEAVDKVMNDLLRFVKRHNVWVGLVSHLRKTPNNGKAFEEGRMPNLDDIKGSGSIKQISMDIIAFARNLMADNLTERNTIDIGVLKCRYTGLTGMVEGARYDTDTGRFSRTGVSEEFVKI